MTAGFTLTVAEAAIAITTVDSWALSLQERYAGFVSQAPARWQLTVQHVSDVTSCLPGEIVHDGPRTRFHVGTFRGQIDLDGRTAAVTATSEAGAASALERAAAYILMQTLPREHVGLLLHATGVIRNGLGYVFFGKSGAGKTTLAHLTPPDADLVCDENVALRVAGSGVQLHSTPFWGHSTPPDLIRRHNASAPLAGLFSLAHGPEFRLDVISPAEAVAELLDTEKVATERVDSALAWLAAAEQIVARVPVRRLTFRPDPAVWDFLASQGT